MELETLEQELSVCKVRSVPEAVLASGLYFIGRTDEELSLVCDTALCDAALAPDDCIAREDGWRAMRVCGTLDFSLTGILAHLSTALADAGIGIFAVSTYNTDYILVKADDLPRALIALEEAGHAIAKR